MHDLSIQIVNYKTKEYLEKCLETLLKDLANSRIDYKINVLDNNSGDDLFELKRLYTTIDFYINDENVGFGSGHNILARKSEAKNILILNPDIEFVEKNTVDRLLSTIKSDVNIKVIGPRLINKEKKTQPWDHGEVEGLIAKIINSVGNSYWKERKNKTEVAWVSGAVMMIEKEVFNELNGFDEQFFLYKEEEDLCLRIRKRGGKIIYDPNITVSHYGSVIAKKDEHMQASVGYFLDKHFRNKFGYRFFKVLNRITH